MHNRKSTISQGGIEFYSTLLSAVVVCLVYLVYLLVSGQIALPGHFILALFFLWQ